MSEEQQVLNVNSNLNNPNNQEISIQSPKYQDPLHPFEYQCYKCQKQVSTVVNSKIGSGTWVCALLWCNLFFFPGLVPFCVRKCQDQIHNCPECQAELYKYHYEPCNFDKN